MPDKKLTDNEILKALECCMNWHDKKDCAKCPMDESKNLCITELRKLSFDLINRLQAEKQILEIELKAMRGAANSYKAENERLEEKLNRSQDRYFGISNLAHKYRNKVKTAKAEAYKEFAEKTNSVIDSLIEKYSIKDFEEFKAICQVLRGFKNDTYNLLKELVGE